MLKLKDTNLEMVMKLGAPCKEEYEGKDWEDAAACGDCYKSDCKQLRPMYELNHCSYSVPAFKINPKMLVNEIPHVVREAV